MKLQLVAFKEGYIDEVIEKLKTIKNIKRPDSENRTKK
jgi:hypothetical protein